MDILIANFKWVMLVAGLVTLSMLWAAAAPRAAMTALFGEGVDGPLATLLARNWGVLIGLTGAMLLWGAFHVEVRPLVLLVAGASKLTFIGLVLANPAFRRRAMVPLVVDGLFVALFVAYLLAAPGA